MPQPNLCICGHAAQSHDFGRECTHPYCECEDFEPLEEDDDGDLEDDDLEDDDPDTLFGDLDDVDVVE